MEIDGRKIGIIGYVTPKTETISNPGKQTEVIATERLREGRGFALTLCCGFLM